MLILQPREFAEISLKDIDQVAKSSFPLCMRHLFEKVKVVVIQSVLLLLHHKSIIKKNFPVILLLPFSFLCGD